MTVSALLACQKQSTAALSVVVSTSADGGATWTDQPAVVVPVGESGSFDVTKNQQHLTLATAAPGVTDVEIEAQNTQEKVLDVTLMSPGVPNTFPNGVAGPINKTRINVDSGEYQVTALIEEA